MATGVPPSVSLTPGQRTAEQLIRYVLNAFQSERDDDNAAAVLEALNAAVDELNTEDWNMLEAIQDIPTAADTADYALNPDVKKPRHLHMLDSSGRRQWRVPFLSEKKFDTLRPFVSGSEDAQTYTIRYGRRLLSFDSPVSSGFVSRYPTARLTYFRRLPHYTQGSSTLGPVPSEFGRFVGLWGRYEYGLMRGMSSSEVDRALRMAETFRNRMLVSDNGILTDWHRGESLQ